MFDLVTSTKERSPRLRRRLRVIGEHDPLYSRLAAHTDDPETLQICISSVGTAALVRGGTVAIVSGPDEIETVVSYPTNENRRPES